jgi:hypothetical protein
MEIAMRDLGTWTVFCLHLMKKVYSAGKAVKDVQIRQKVIDRCD